MKTRTLLVLSVATGLAILVAGLFMLLRLNNAEAPEPPLAIGETAQVGDASITVRAVDTDTEDVLIVTVDVAGVDDPQGLDGFALRAADVVVPGSDAESDCTGFTVAPLTCTLRFDITGLAGSQFDLLARRGEAFARWSLTG